MLLPEHIAADRLVLRRPRREDAPAVAEAIAESLKELAGWFQWAQLLQRFADPEDMGDRATVANLRFDDLHNPVYFIWEGDRLQGEVILDNPLWEEERAAIEQFVNMTLEVPIKVVTTATERIIIGRSYKRLARQKPR